MQAMIGKTLTKVLIAKDKMAIKFIFDDNEEIIAKCDADCCSHTWIEHVEMPSLPGKVIAAENIDMPNLSTGKEEDYTLTQYYGFKITLSTGHLIIDYRNNSNGYYGGSLSWPDDTYFYGGVHGGNVSNEQWEVV